MHSATASSIWERREKHKIFSRFAAESTIDRPYSRHSGKHKFQISHPEQEIDFQEVLDLSQSIETQNKLPHGMVRTAPTNDSIKRSARSALGFAVVERFVDVSLLPEDYEAMLQAYIDLKMLREEEIIGPGMPIVSDNEIPVMLMITDVAPLEYSYLED